MDNQDRIEFAGKNGFTWWMGIVEDKQDPLKLGRCRVRCVGWHSDNKMDLPTNMLPWAMSSNPVNNIHPYAPREGDMVFGFFTDGEKAQNPIMLGVLPGIPLEAPDSTKAFNDSRTPEILAKAPRFPASKTYNTDGSGIVIIEKSTAELYTHSDKLDEPTTPRMARNDPETITKTFIQERKDKVVKGVKVVNTTWDEPLTKYDTLYPYNNVNETESGHHFELDDTFGKERIHLAHRNGSFQEWYPNGDKVEKITRDNFQIVMKDDHIYIMGKCFITVQKDAEIHVQKDAYINVDGDVKVGVGGNYYEHVAGSYTVISDGDMKINGRTINLNNGINGAVRIGDHDDDSESNGPDKMVEGSHTVFIGD
jgi:hypothetical protein